MRTEYFGCPEELLFLMQRPMPKRAVVLPVSGHVASLRARLGQLGGIGCFVNNLDPGGRETQVVLAHLFTKRVPAHSFEGRQMCRLTSLKKTLGDWVGGCILLIRRDQHKHGEKAQQSGTDDFQHALLLA